MRQGARPSLRCERGVQRAEVHHARLHRGAHRVHPDGGAGAFVAGPGASRGRIVGQLAECGCQRWRRCVGGKRSGARVAWRSCQFRVGASSPRTSARRTAVGKRDGICSDKCTVAVAAGPRPVAQARMARGGLSRRESNCWRWRREDGADWHTDRAPVKSAFRRICIRICVRGRGAPAPHRRDHGGREQTVPVHLRPGHGAWHGPGGIGELRACVHALTGRQRGRHRAWVTCGVGFGAGAWWVPGHQHQSRPWHHCAPVLCGCPCKPADFPCGTSGDATASRCTAGGRPLALLFNLLWRRFHSHCVRGRGLRSSSGSCGLWEGQDPDCRGGWGKHQ
mmetsp:Transcript_21919/g.70565  ORF Transcript_21919/g.70565 Transcript_21919/m.70565 type:complete len:336 (+) Transcript_21919:603-1610(+)